MSCPVGAQVARVADLGSNDTTYHVRTHLGHLLHPGDTALGYDLTRANFVSDDLESFVQKGNPLPDVVLVSLPLHCCCTAFSCLAPSVSADMSVQSPDRVNSATATSQTGVFSKWHESTFDKC